MSEHRHGGRRHYNYNAPVYQELCSRIVEKMADHYGSHPSVIGWQIDNELNCETSEFYSEADSAAFREFLKGKYGLQHFSPWGFYEVHIKPVNLYTAAFDEIKAAYEQTQTRYAHPTLICQLFEETFQQ